MRKNPGKISVNGFDGGLLPYDGRTHSESLGDHAGYQGVQADALLPRPSDKAGVESAGHALPPLSACLARLWNCVSVFRATEKIRANRVAAVGDSLLRSVSIGNAARQIGVFNHESATIFITEWVDRKRKGIDDGTVDLHFDRSRHGLWYYGRHY